MKELKPEDFNDNIFKLIGKEWMLIICKHNDKINTMTASWGAVGIMWGKPTVTIYIRKSRYTKEFVDNEDRFSLCVLPEDKRDILNFCGSKSGRDYDKIKECNLHVEYSENIPFFSESRVVLICKKMFHQVLTKNSFENIEIYKKWYPTDDLHEMYIAEIEKILIK